MAEEMGEQRREAVCSNSGFLFSSQVDEAEMKEVCGKRQRSSCKEGRRWEYKRKGLETRRRKQCEKRSIVKLLKDRKEKQMQSAVVNKVRTNGEYQIMLRV